MGMFYVENVEKGVCQNEFLDNLFSSYGLSQKDKCGVSAMDISTLQGFLDVRFPSNV
jgi:hypothetical protein